MAIALCADRGSGTQQNNGQSRAKHEQPPVQDVGKFIPEDVRTHISGIPKQSSGRYLAAMRRLPAFLLPLLGMLLLGEQDLAARQVPQTSSPEGHPPQQVFPREPLDINTAGERALRALPGMGAVYAQRIVEGRPYTAKNQLITRGVLPQAAYAAIRDRIVAHRPAPMP